MCLFEHKRTHHCLFQKDKGFHFVDKPSENDGGFSERSKWYSGDCFNVGCSHYSQRNIFTTLEVVCGREQCERVLSRFRFYCSVLRIATSVDELRFCSSQLKNFYQGCQYLKYAIMIKIIFVFVWAGIFNISENVASNDRTYFNVESEPRSELNLMCGYT